MVYWKVDQPLLTLSLLPYSISSKAAGGRGTLPRPFATLSKMESAGILGKFFNIIPVLRIRDVYPESRILIFTHPGSKNSNKREG
jgi:hypothetical protein